LIAAILRWLPLSLALHSAALAATLLLPRDAALLPLFVDLTLVEAITPPDRPSGASDSAAPPRRQRAAAEPRRGVPPPASAAVSPPSARVPDAVSPPVDPVPMPRVASPESTPPPAAANLPASMLPAVESNAEVLAPPPSPAPVSTATQNRSATTRTAEPGGGSSVSSGTSAAASGGETPVGPAVLSRDTGRGSGEAGAGGAGDALALGISGDDGGVYAGYIALLRRRVQEALTYPSAARRRGMSGTVHLDISVEPTGRIAEVLVVRSSSHDVLDAAALDAVRALRHVPFPPGVRPRAVRVRLPVVFELR
jgi:periplasmic protein TonB